MAKAILQNKKMNIILGKPRNKNEVFSMKINKTTAPKPKPTDQNHLGFGKLFTDHMLVMEYHKETGWQEPEIKPYGNFSLDPATMALHYGQEIFEGLKAYKTSDGHTLLFRPEDNFKRMNKSGERLCIPPLDTKKAFASLLELIKLDDAWIPTEEGTSLYIRPTIISIDPFLGVKASESYLFFIILSPVGAYYSSGLEPVKIYVEDEYVRAVKGGTGFTKCAGNYAASLAASEKAKHLGYSQVLWLDGLHHKYIEEVGSMNIFFVIDNVLVTPALEGSILPGITRNSVLQYAAYKDIKVEERRLSIEEVLDASKSGKLNECFGSGTAAVISPVGELRSGNTNIIINNGKMGPIAEMMYNDITGIQYGKIADPFGWVVEVK